MQFLKQDNYLGANLKFLVSQSYSQNGLWCQCSSVNDVTGLGVQRLKSGGSGEDISPSEDLLGHQTSRTWDWPSLPSNVKVNNALKHVFTLPSELLKWCFLRSCDQPTRTRFSVVLLGPRANDELAPQFNVALHSSHTGFKMLTFKIFSLIYPPPPMSD
jgi:hypothetical protein